MPAENSSSALHFPATQRNREPILHTLKEILPPAGTVLEIASGSGEHTAYFSACFPDLTWQPSDRDPALLASIAAHSEAADAPNVQPPLQLDVGKQPWPITSANAVICINMIHIAPWSTCRNLLGGARSILPPGAPLFLYGPFKRDGKHTAPSNEAFDYSLRARDPSWGIRDLGVVTDAAQGFAPDRVIEMPANNLSVILRRTG